MVLHLKFFLGFLIFTNMSIRTALNNFLKIILNLGETTGKEISRNKNFK